ncbi:hypothetical protein APHAL10511_000108 [Amanita phalloides]|nr:hypothetical protein APHAL10511_000108 [Amanita phalloides]
MVQYWEPGTQYNYGDVVLYEGHKYKIIQPHRSQSDWTPDVTPALWGKLSDGDDGGYQQHQQQQQPFQPPSNPPYPGAPQYGDQGSSYPEKSPDDGGSDPSGENKHWWDDEANKKKLEIGGGLIAGAGLIGAGLFAYKHHKEKQEEHKSQEWARENWIAEAQSRTADLRSNGPRGPATWVLTHGTVIPSGAIVVSREPYPMYTCRTYIDGGIQLGKVSSEFEKGAAIGYGNKEQHFDEYEILLGDMRGLHWVSSHGTINVGALGARPVEGGHENDGTPLYIVRAYYKDGVHPGKASPKLKGAYIAWDGGEKAVENYEVLCYA